MKKNKLFGLLGIIALTCLVMACGDNTNKTGSRDVSNKQTVKSILEDAANASAEEEPKEETKEAPVASVSVSEPPAPQESSEEIEEGDFIDLTVLSSVLVYTEVYNMVYYPENYEGKIIKAKGPFDVYVASEEEKALYGTDCYFYVVVQDATACCQQGLEFVLKEDPGFPDGYPSVGTEVTVCGRYETYQEGDTTYAHLVDATWEF
ncbi:MAG: hypothetical protein IK068_03560 [Lachnospiraceae bacterium]|nr:hypothetical protein [Lachnospiraceae bacterium]